MARRSNGEGSITKRKDGRYSIKWYDAEGNRQTGTTRTLKEAKEKLRQHLEDADRGVDVSQDKMLLKEWLDILLENYAKPTVGQSTYANYYSNVHKHIVPYFGNTQLRSVSTLKMQMFYGNLSTAKRQMASRGAYRATALRKSI